MAAEIPNGAVLVARAILNSSLWTMRPEDCKVAITCIALANWKDQKWFDGTREITIHRGQFVRSREDFANSCGLSLQKTRTAIKHLEKVGFLTRNPTSTYTLFTIPKYSHYQDLTKYSDSVEVKANPVSNPQLTRSQPAPNPSLTRAQPAPNHKQEGEEREERKEGEEGGAASPLGLLLTKAEQQSIPGKPETLRTYFKAWIARTDYTRTEQIILDPWSKGKTILEIQDHFFPKGQNGHQPSRSDAHGNTKCLSCGGSGKVAGSVVNGKIQLVPCRHCAGKAAAV